VLDLTGLEFIDSSGIRVLITAAKKSGQPLLLRHPDHQVRRVLDIALPRAQPKDVWELA
jgi:anti-anti-sigma factor